MSELIGWIVVAGLVLIIIGIFLLSSQLANYIRIAMEIIVNGNKLILERLDRIVQSSNARQNEGAGRTERRATQRRDPLVHMKRMVMSEERRRSIGRRKDDLLAAQAAGYMP